MIYENYFKPMVGLLLFVAIFTSATALAHGGGSSEPAKEKPKSVQSDKRAIPAAPTLIEYSELAKIMSQQKSPSDVAIIRCTLNGYANCRGLEIVLYDLKGKYIVAGNSGSEGVVGFEGLKEGHKYEARLAASKYKGSLILTPGGAWMLNADRIVD